MAREEEVVPHVTLDGSSLTLETLVRAARDPAVRVRCDADALRRVEVGRRQIEDIAGRYEQAIRELPPGDGASIEALPHVYGVTTGFGEFKNAPIALDDLERLQRNILLSHCAGVGDNCDADDPVNYFPAEVVRAALVMRLNTFLKGHSGVRVELIRRLEGMINEGIVPLVPTRGSVGSSGDLCPLAHTFAVLLGAGRFYRVERKEDLKRGRSEWLPAERLPDDLRIEPSYKEGLALTNGATYCAAMLAICVHDALNLVSAADAAAAMTLEAMCGRRRAFDPKVHRARNQAGQADVAANLLTLLEGSRLADRSADVQDPYSLRCAPAVHGASRDALAYARMVAEREINAASDNPLFFPGEAPCDQPAASGDDATNTVRDYAAYSAGNFHGQPIGIAADFLAIALAELADISERRVQMLLDRRQNRNLPANLVAFGGVHSGLMLAQYCAAALVSENKVLAHPASVDSIPTSANVEDHNSMATIAARKLQSVLANVQAVLGIELMVAAQAVDCRVGMKRSPNASPPMKPERTSFSKSEAELNQLRETLSEGGAAIEAELGRGTRIVYRLVRESVPPLFEDRPLDEDIRRIRSMVADGSLAAAVESGVEGRLHPVRALCNAHA